MCHEGLKARVENSKNKGSRLPTTDLQNGKKRGSSYTSNHSRTKARDDRRFKPMGIITVKLLFNIF